MDNKSEADRRKLFKHAEMLFDAVHILFEGQHIDCIGNALLLLVNQYMKVVPPDERIIFTNSLVETIRRTENNLNALDREHAILWCQLHLKVWPSNTKSKSPPGWKWKVNNKSYRKPEYFLINSDGETTVEEEI